MSDIEKLTHGAEREGDSVRVPENHPAFRFPRKEDQQATAPYPGGVAVLASQLLPDQRAQLGLPEEDAAEPQPEPAEPTQEAQSNGEQQDGDTHQTEA